LDNRGEISSSLIRDRFMPAFSFSRSGKKHFRRRDTGVDSVYTGGMKILKVCYIQLVENPMIHIMTDELAIGKYYYYNLRTGAWNFPDVSPEVITGAEEFLGVSGFDELTAFRGQKLSPEAEESRDMLTRAIRDMAAGDSGNGET